MQKAQQVRTQLLTLMMAGAAGISFAATAADVGIKADVGTDAKVMAPDNAQAGGVAGAHMSSSGSGNGNAQWQSGAAQGVDRAAERMSLSGTGSGAEFDATGKAAVKSKRTGTR